MENLTQIQEKLDSLYQECQEKKAKKSKISKGKNQEIILLLGKLAGNPEATTDIIAAQLLRFPSGICKEYFDSLTKNACLSIELVDELLKKTVAADSNISKILSYVPSVIIVIIKNYEKNKLYLKSAQLPELVAFIAKYALNSDNNRNQFQNVINKTSGAIYLLDYSAIGKKELNNIWNVTKKIYPDLSQARYESFITEWAEKYGFIRKKTEIQSEPVQEISENIAEIQPEPVKEMSENNHAVLLTAFKEEFAPVLVSMQNLQENFLKNQTAVLNLNATVSSLEHQIKQLSQRITEMQKEKDTETHRLSSEIAELETRNAELDAKLKEAYQLNSREASLEAEKIRADLIKNLSFLYEDWLDYEHSDVSEENYESLQAIIKKIFRAIERNGINVKGNHT